MRVALVQLNASDDPLANLDLTEGFVRAAAAGGARLALTPEVTNLVSFSRAHQNAVLCRQEEDPTLGRLSAVTAELGIWLLIGSLALKADGGRFVNRSFLLRPDGTIAATYDKIHMFDVELADGESYRESAAFRPGDKAVLADIGKAKIGMTICYDMRFPYLYRQLAKAGAGIFSVPSAFTVPTGRAHWHALLRARAIETGAFVLAPAQTGTHASANGPQRRTFGHSLAVSPWGTVLADAGTAPGVTPVDLDLKEVETARRRIPALTHDRDYSGPG